LFAISSRDAHKRRGENRVRAPVGRPAQGNASHEIVFDGSNVEAVRAHLGAAVSVSTDDVSFGATSGPALCLVQLGRCYPVEPGDSVALDARGRLRVNDGSAAWSAERIAVEMQRSHQEAEQGRASGARLDPHRGVGEPVMGKARAEGRITGEWGR